MLDRLVEYRLHGFRSRGPELTKAIKDLRSTTDLAKHKAAAGRISTILAEDVPHYFVDTALQGIAFARGVHADNDMTLPDGGIGRPTIGGAAINWSSLWTDE